MSRFGTIFLLLHITFAIQASGKSSYTRSPGHFTENRGQLVDQYNQPNPAVLFLLNTPGMNVQLRRGGFSYDLYNISNTDQRMPDVEVSRSATDFHGPETACSIAANLHHSRGSDAGGKVNFHRIDFDLAGSNPNCLIITSGPSSDYLNYYTSGTPVEGVTNVRSFQSIIYKNIYPNIDLEFMVSGLQGFKYNFVVRPGGKISSIRMKIADPEILVSTSGALMLRNTIDGIKEDIPDCFYLADSLEVKVKCRFHRISKGILGFSTDLEVPGGATLIIDPVPTRVWATYYGGTDNDEGNGCAVDGAGNVYISGKTQSLSNIATSGAYQTTLQGSYDTFLTKFSPSGVLLWGTYVGGTDWEENMNCTVDKAGNTYIAGETWSASNIATPGCHQPVFGGFTDCYLIKFTPGGQRIWGTYYGGTNDEQLGVVKTDDRCNVYLAGVTHSENNISTSGSFDPNFNGGDDTFLVKFDSSGQRQWGTYYGGPMADRVYDCSISKNGFVYITGMTASAINISTPGSFQQNWIGGFGGMDGYLACFNTDGQRLWGTYYGGNGIDECTSVATDTLGNAYISGHTSSANIIASSGSYQPVYAGNGDVFLARFSPDGTRRWGTYYGGTGHDSTNYCSFIAVDDSSHIYMTGITNSLTGIATPDTYQTTFAGGYDIFLVKFDSAGQRIWGTYYGGSSNETGGSGALDPAGFQYLTGITSSVNGISTEGSHQKNIAGGLDAFLVKFQTCRGADTAKQITGPFDVCQGTTGIVFTVPVIAHATGYQWTLPVGFLISGGSNTNTITVSVAANAVSGQVTVYGTNDCANGVPSVLVVAVHPGPVPSITGFTTAILGTVYTYTTEPGMSNYQWTFSTGGTLVGGGGISDDFIQVQWTMTAAQWVRVNYTGPDGCMALNPAQKNILVTTTSLVVDFTAPDTVFTNANINITNLTQGASTYYWSFCSGNANTDPTGVNIGNPGSLLTIPTYITLVKQDNDCFSFISVQGVGVVRYFHGTSFANFPVSWAIVATFGSSGFSTEGIQVKQDNGNWYGFVNCVTTMYRLDFGTSLWNTPTVVNIGPFAAFNMAHGLVITQEAGAWVGFVTCSTGQKLLRLDFGTSLANIPAVTDFGSMGGILVSPAAICLVQENSLWYALIMAGGNTLARITFGTSLFNTPTGVSLGNPGGFNSAGGLTLLRDCESTTGYWVNYLVNGELGKLTFPTGITGSVSGAVLGNIGGLARPHSFSEIFRQNDTLFAYITDRDNGTLTRLTFPPCTSASVASSTLFTPPPFSYSQPGTYNIRLIVNEGLPDQTSLCKNIVVADPPVTAAFTIPDTVCTGSQVTITNQSTTGGTYYWSFCSGNALSNPFGTNIGNPGTLLNIPGYMTLVKDGNTCYSFVTNQGNKSVVRYNHGASFNNNPVSWTNLGGFGMLGDTVLGIKILYSEGQWIGFVNNNNRIMRLNFGTSLANFPTATLLGPYAMLNTAHCLDIFNEGGTWVGYITCSWGNKLVRFNFGNSLLNNPVLTDLGTPGSLNMPGSFRIISENGIWYGLVVNLGDATMSRLTFGSSLLNDPAGVNLGIVCSGMTSPGGITLIRDCEGTSGFQMNYSTTSSDLIWRLGFPAGITGTVSGTSLGNIGALSRPSQFSELFRVGDTLFLYNTNRQNYTLTRLRFLPCTNASVPSSVLYDPPAFSYNQPGSYNIQLIVNEGLSNQASLCKEIVVMTPLAVNLGNDKSICPGNSALLDAGANFSSYLWSTGATTRTITVSAPGSYSVTATRWGCSSNDAINVSQLSGPAVNLGPDVTICAGQTNTFDAGACPGCSFQWTDLTTMQMNIGNGQTYTTGTAGNYMVTVVGPNSCTGRDTAQLFVNPVIAVTVSITVTANPVCTGTQVTFTAFALPVGFIPQYQWRLNGFDVGGNSQFFTYTPSQGDCMVCVVTTTSACVMGSPATSNQICMTVNPILAAGVTAVASSNPVCAGTAVAFNATPVHGGTTPAFQWKVNAINATGATNASYAYVPVGGDVITCEMTSSDPCTSGNPATSTAIIMTVLPGLPVGVSVLPSATTVCAGTMVTFWATPVHGGTTPGYQWKVNTNNAVNGNNASYAYVPLNGDVVTCEVTSSDSCTVGNPATSVPITMTVNPNLPVTVSIGASSNPYCAGSSVTFTATPGFGGPTPVYQWKINGINAINGNNPSYVYNPLPGDVVSCELTSSETCTSGNPATSNTITMVATPLLPAAITITATPNPFCPGTAVTFDAFPVHGGTAPAYQWKVNAINAINAINASYTYNPVAGDLVSCELTSNQPCVTNNPVTSTAILMTTRPAPQVSFTRCFDSITTTLSKPFHLKGGLPPGGTYTGAGVNPVTGIFNPSAAGAGAHPITYTYTNTYGCTANATTTVATQTAMPLICGNTFTDPRDNRHYTTFSLPNGKCWMKENLDFGVTVPDLTLQTDNCLAEKYRRYSVTSHQYSAFYQWDELMQYDNMEAMQGLCPPGWHIPTAPEWNDLISFSTGPGQAGGPLKDTLLANGFHSCQQGLFYLNNTWAFVTGIYAGTMYWTSTVFDTERATARGINEFNFSVSLYNSSRENAFNIRCLHD